MSTTLTAPGGLLTVSPRIEERLRDGELTPQQVDEQMTRFSREVLPVLERAGSAVAMA